LAVADQTMGSAAVRLWDRATGEELLLLPHASPVRAIAFGPDGKRLASASGSLLRPGVVQVWDTTSGRALVNLPQAGQRASIAFSSDGKTLICAVTVYDAARRMWTGGEAKLYDAGSGKEIAVLKHPGAVRHVALSADGRRLVTVAGNAQRHFRPVPAEVLDRT